eukprot:PITA_10651
MPPRREGGIGQRKLVSNAVLLDEIQNMHTRMEIMETTQRREPNEGDASAAEESSKEEEDDESDTAKVIKILAKESGRPEVEIPLGRDIRCYTCGEWGHGSWDYPHNKVTNHRNVNVAKPKEEKPQIADKEESPKVGESLLLKRVLLKAEKETREPTQGKSLFRTTCMCKGKCCKIIIDSGSTDNLVSTKMVDKLGLVKTVHPIPYKVSWLQKGHQLIVIEQCKVEIHIGTYKDMILFDVIPMDVCHVLLGIPWQFDWKAIHDGRRNTYTLEKNGNKHTLLPLKDEAGKEASRNSVMLMSWK